MAYNWYRIRVTHNLSGLVVSTSVTAWLQGRDDVGSMVARVNKWCLNEYGPDFFPDIQWNTSTKTPAQPDETLKWHNISKVILGNSYKTKKLKFSMRSKQGKETKVDEEQVFITKVQ